MKLDGGDETIIKAGDYLLQRGTMHQWYNHTKEPCRILVVVGHRGRQGVGCLLPAISEEGMIQWWIASVEIEAYRIQDLCVSRYVSFDCSRRGRYICVCI